MKEETQLTSVNILEDVDKRFKLSTEDNSMNLQKVVNRTLDLYNKDENFRQTINNHNGLAATGSKY